MLRKIMARSMSGWLLLGMFVWSGCGGGGGGPTEDLNIQAMDEAQGGLERLVRNLDAKTSTNPNIRRDSVNRLGALGAKAATAIPAVEKCAAEDPDEKVRQAATEALAKIKS